MIKRLRAKKKILLTDLETNLSLKNIYLVIYLDPLVLGEG